MTAFDPYQAPLSSVDESAEPAALAGGQPALPAAIETLRRTRPWVLLLGILGFVSCGLAVLGGLMVVLGAALAGTTGAGGVGVVEASILGLIYLIGGAVSFLFAWLLVRYSSAISRAVATTAPVDLVAALDAQRLLWKVIGISTIIYVALVFLAGVFIVIGATASAMAGGL